MAGNIKGIIVEIGGDTSGLQKALRKVNSETSSLSKELKGINRLLKLDPKNTELLNQKQTVLKESIEATKNKIKELKNVYNESVKAEANGAKISEENLWKNTDFKDYTGTDTIKEIGILNYNNYYCFLNIFLLLILK